MMYATYVAKGKIFSKKGILNFLGSDKRLLDEIKGDVMLERDPMVNLCKKNEMNCFIHDGFWKCFDTAKDVKSFKEIY